MSVSNQTQQSVPGTGDSSTSQPHCVVQPNLGAKPNIQQQRPTGRVRRWQAPMQPRSPTQYRGTIIQGHGQQRNPQFHDRRIRNVPPRRYMGPQAQSQNRDNLPRPQWGQGSGAHPTFQHRGTPITPPIQQVAPQPQYRVNPPRQQWSQGTRAESPYQGPHPPQRYAPSSPPSPMGTTGHWPPRPPQLLVISIQSPPHPCLQCLVNQLRGLFLQPQGPFTMSL